MGWSGETASVTPVEIRAALKGIADELGLVVRCACGGARWCPAKDAYETSQAFWKLHASHRKG